MSGAWTYTLDQATVQDLDEGEIVTDTITLTATDGTTQDIAITITGTDDAPLVSGVFSAAVDEGDLGDTVTATGTIDINDVDGDDNPVFADVTLAGSYGTLELVSGNWIYTVNQSAVQQLNVGDTLTDAITLTATDGTVQDIAITITGTDDAPVVSGVFSGALDEGDPGDTVTVSGTITITDADSGDSPNFADIILVGSYGTLSLVGGTWTYTLDQVAVQALGVGESVTDVITLTASDGTLQDITLTVTGTNDAPSISGSFSGSVGESGLDEGTASGSTANLISGRLSFADQDGDSLTLVFNGVSIGELDGTPAIIGTVAGDYGTWTLHGDGSWEYELDTAVDHASVSAPTEQALVAVDDGSVVTAPVSISIAITDDGVTAENVTTTMHQAGGLSLTGVLNVGGADVLYSADLTANVPGWSATGITHADSGLTSNGWALYYHVDPSDPSSLIAYRDSAGHRIPWRTR